MKRRLSSRPQTSVKQSSKNIFGFLIGGGIALAAILMMFSPAATTYTETDTPDRGAETNQVIRNSVLDSLADGGTLPVHLISFSIEKEKATAMLKWATVSEINSDEFQVERSPDGLNFFHIGQVKAAGNSNGLRSYAFEDKTLNDIAASPIFYRLKQIDLDGTFVYSEVKAFFVEQQNDFWVEILGNPVKDVIRLNYVAEVEEPLHIRIVSMTGQTAFSGTLSGSKEKKMVSIPTLDWTSGIYTLQISNRNHAVTEKLFLQ